MGVFTNLFQDEIKFIEEKYKIKILEIKNIDNGILNSNFYIETKNKKYILRIYEANRIVDEEKQELILLDKIAGFIPVSKAIKNIDNEYISIFTNKKFALFEYINGNSITKIDTHIVREIAMYLGKLHSFSKEISFEEYNRKTRIDFNFYYNEIKKSEINFRFKNELLNLANEINDFDFFTENNLIRDFLNYYSKYRKITKEELKSLDIACKKIALTFIFLRIYKKKIENSYQKAISIQKKSYLDLIKLIDKYEK